MLDTLRQQLNGSLLVRVGNSYDLTPPALELREAAALDRAAPPRG